ncbi:ABC transporter permease [Paenibacillus sp. SC116]|uniref:ABC transporter permease n=1 Tax=Paenibacillus sp. SC116 TaxID=2968986 RepID=UPI00215B1A75|nr:ABC transporter permease [Paenibacillus sp. SC116]MCR8843545.1 ABC transporter permease [Paenibacillus sp. SC116]
MNTTNKAMPRIAQDSSLFSGNSKPVSPKAFTAIRIFVWRTWKHTSNNLFVYGMDVALSPILTLLIFTYLFGGAIAGSTTAYLQYFLPGFLLLTILPMTVYSGTTLCQDIVKGVYNRFRTMPFWQPATMIGSVLMDGLRYTSAALVSFCVGMLLGFRPEGGALGAIMALLFIVCFAFSVSWIFSMMGVLVKKPETVSGTSMMLMYPLLFASNILVDPDTMPDWMGVIVGLNPISIAATTARGLMHGTASTSDIAAGVGVCLLLLVLFVPLTIYFYMKKVK